MNLNDWLDDSKHVGRTSWLAERLGVTKGAVSQWRVRGVPKARMAAIQDVTAGAVTVEEMLRHSYQATVSEARNA